MARVLGKQCGHEGWWRHAAGQEKVLQEVLARA